MKFLVSKLKDLGLPSEIDPEDGPRLIFRHSSESEREIVVDRPPASVHDFVADDRPVGYSRGATESQDERPWQDEDEVEATLVRKVEKIMTVWEAIT